MKNTSNAIKLAIEKGGYNSEVAHIYPKDDGSYGVVDDGVKAVALDPLFWRALGKALRWHEYDLKLGDIIEVLSANELTNAKVTAIAKNEVKLHVLKKKSGYIHIPMKEWLYQALRYHELVLTGGNLDAFWDSLLKGNN